MEYEKMTLHALNQRQQIAEKQRCHSFALDDIKNMKREMNKHGNNDSGIGCSPPGLKLEDEPKESLPNYSQQSPTIESTHLSYFENLQTEDFRMRGDIDHVFTDSVKCELCDFKPTRLFQYYHHIIVHCKRTDDSDFETDSAQTEIMSTESLHNDDDFLTETPNKKKKRRKTIKPKRCKLRNCNFVTSEGLDVMEAKMELWKHLRENHKYPLVCRLCPFVTEPKHHMVYHWLGDHTKLRPFKCEVPNCTYSCVAKSMLNSHMVRHWTVYQYNCKDCHFKARLLHAMKKHMREKNHTHVLILNEDGTQNLKTIIDIYSNKRGPRRKIPAKIKDKSDQIDLNQSSSPIPSPEHQELVSHSEPQSQQQLPQQQLPLVESDSNINRNNNQSNLYVYSSLFQTLYNLSSIISDALLHWNHDNENATAWQYLVCMFHSLFGNEVTGYCNRAHMNRLERLFAMREVVDANIKHLRKSYNMDNPETSNNNEAGPSNENTTDIERPSTFGLTYQLTTQNISMKDYAQFERTDSESDTSDDKKDIDRVSTSNKRKIEPEKLDDTVTTGNNFHLINNEADAFNKIPNTTSELKFQSQKDMIPNKPLSISKYKITGATKRKGKTQTRFIVEKNTEQNKTESFKSPMYDKYGLQRESQVNLITDDKNLKYNCKHCELTFGHKMMYRLHMLFHKDNDPFTCEMCGERCSDSLTFHSHLIYAKHY